MSEMRRVIVIAMLLGGCSNRPLVDADGDTSESFGTPVDDEEAGDDRPRPDDDSNDLDEAGDVDVDDEGVDDGDTTGQTFDAVIANNDEMAIGAIFAMEQAGMDPKSVCIDATADALEQMRKGNLDVTVFQDAAGQGKGALDAALKLIRGEPIEPWVMIPYELVTPANMKAYESR